MGAGADAVADEAEGAGGPAEEAGATVGDDAGAGGVDGREAPVGGEAAGGDAGTGADAAAADDAGTDGACGGEAAPDGAAVAAVGEVGAAGAAGGGAVSRSGREGVLPWGGGAARGASAGTTSPSTCSTASPTAPFSTISPRAGPGEDVSTQTSRVSADSRTRSLSPLACGAQLRARGGPSRRTVRWGGLVCCGSRPKSRRAGWGLTATSPRARDASSATARMSRWAISSSASRAPRATERSRFSIRARSSAMAPRRV